MSNDGSGYVTRKVSDKYKSPIPKFLQCERFKTNNLFSLRVTGTRTGMGMGLALQETIGPSPYCFGPL